MTRGSAGVIGGGIFGVAAALELRDLGLAVTLYEKQPVLLAGATGANFFRVHRGYHYPRDEATARQARDGYAPFLGRFAEALAPAVRHYYAIAAAGSLTTGGQFTQHCGRLGLDARPAAPPGLVPGSTAACFEADEFYYDPRMLWRVARELLTRLGVRVKLNWAGGAAAVARAHDVVVVTAYAALNEILAELGCPPAELQYEVCEVVIAEAPRLHGLSLVVLDGPFCSVAPWRDGRHIIYDVDHSVHARATARANPGLRAGPTRFAQIVASARRFADLGDVRHAGSLFAERVVLPGVDATDARPTLVTWAAPGVLSVLSGKVGCSVAAGRAVAAEVAAKLALPEPERVSA